MRNGRLLVMISIVVIVAAITLLYLALAGQYRKAEKGVFPFYLPWDDCEETALSLSKRLAKPAGILGYVDVGEDGHLYVGGERIRFLGVNICEGAAFPEKEEAEGIAGRLAKFGVDVVRFHHMDAGWGSFNIFDRSTGGTRRLSKNALDRLDYFISKLKENGIYVDLNLLVSRRFTAADGLPREIESVDWKDQQALGFFMEEVEELEKEYARQLLTHLNPYTGMTYAEDPAVAFVEIVNEQGLIQSWLGGTIDRLPQVFKDKLKEKWNLYLASKYVSDEEFRRTWGARVEPEQQPELLKNGCFEDGVKNWSLEVHDGAQASSRIVEGPGGKPALEIKVTELGSESWHVQFNQPGLRIVAEESYLVRFRARADRTVRVSIGLVQAHDPWRSVSQRVEILLTTDWKDYEIALAASESEGNARLDVSGLGGNKATYQFSCFSMKRFSGYGPMEDESVENATVRILTLAEYGTRTLAARRDWIEFLYSTEERFFMEMQRFIKDELGVKALVIGTIVGCSTPNIMSKLDVVDTHAYWNHPSFPGIPWDSTNWFVVNEPMVNYPQSTIVGLAAKRVVNKPHFVTEYNHPAPNMYDAETTLILATYAALQDWDGIFLFDYGSRGNWDSRKIRGYFDIDQHPVKMATLIPAHLIFLRGDVKPADRLVTVKLDKQDEINLIASGKVFAWMLPDASNAGLNPTVSLVHRTAIVTGEGSYSNASLSVSGPVYRSDNKEVTWDTSESKKGMILVNTSRSIAVIGFGGGRKIDFGTIVVEPGETLLDGWSVISLSVLDGESFESCDRALIVAAGYATNTGMRLHTYEDKEEVLTWSNNLLSGIKIYNERITCDTSWGSAPTVVEGVPATIRIKTNLGVEVWALDNVGRRVKQVPVSNEGQYKVFSIGLKFETIWYEIVFKK